MAVRCTNCRMVHRHTKNGRCILCGSINLICIESSQKKSAEPFDHENPEDWRKQNIAYVTVYNEEEEGVDFYQGPFCHWPERV